MISSMILELKDDASVGSLSFPAGTEFHIIQDMVYMHGHPLPPDSQEGALGWITGNMNLFKEIFR